MLDNQMLKLTPINAPDELDDACKERRSHILIMVSSDPEKRTLEESDCAKQTALISSLCAAIAIRFNTHLFC